MIYGIGTDICDKRRIEKILSHHSKDRFIGRILAPSELRVFKQRYIQSKARGVEYLASRFSAKESLAKAIGLGIRYPMTWQSCEILNLDMGQPTVRLYQELCHWCQQKRLKFHVSLSDEKDYVLTYVIAEMMTNPHSQFSQR